jgi:hypothetical protein
MTDRTAKDAGPMLFNNSLRAWQARYKAQRAAASANRPQAAAPASAGGNGQVAEGPTARLR